MSDVLLRAATAADADAIAGIWYHGWRDAHFDYTPAPLMPYRQPDEFRRRVPSKLEATTVATIDDQVAGFVMIHDDEVEQVYVAAEARGSGVANALLQHAEKSIAENFDVAWLAVIPQNPRARRFYERNGWRDGGAFDYGAAAGEATVPVRCHRYEKRVR